MNETGIIGQTLVKEILHAVEYSKYVKLLLFSSSSCFKLEFGLYREQASSKENV